MAEISEVDVVDGVPVGGTGEVPTLVPIRDGLGLINATPAATPADSTGLSGLLRGFWTSLGLEDDAAAAAGGEGSLSAKLAFMTTKLDQMEDHLATIATPSSDPVPVHAVHRTDVVALSATTTAIPKYAIIDAATSGDNTLLAAVTSKKIRVLSLYIIAAGIVNVRFESGAGGTALSGQLNLVANVGFVLPFNPLGWFETAVTTLLNLELSAAISVDGGFNYIEV